MSAWYASSVSLREEGRGGGGEEEGQERRGGERETGRRRFLPGYKVVKEVAGEEVTLSLCSNPSFCKDDTSFTAQG